MNWKINQVTYNTTDQYVGLVFFLYVMWGSDVVMWHCVLFAFPHLHMQTYSEVHMYLDNDRMLIILSLFATIMN